MESGCFKSLLLGNNNVPWFILSYDVDFYNLPLKVLILDFGDMILFESTNEDCFDKVFSPTLFNIPSTLFRLS